MNISALIHLSGGGGTGKSGELKSKLFPTMSHGVFTHALHGLQGKSSHHLLVFW